MKVRSIRKISFRGLRAYGGSFDNDVRLTYLCRVVRVEDGLKWQIVRNKHQFNCQLVDHDQESLNEYDVAEVEVVNVRMLKYSF